jgi:hypothetical protein
MSSLLETGIEVTALHNHFSWDDLHIYYMHLHGMGTAANLARRVKPAFDLIGQVKPGTTSSLRSGGQALDTAKIAQIVGHTGEPSGDVYKITICRNDFAMKDHGATITARMGLNTWAADYGTREDAVVAGDIAMLEGEVPPVLKELRTSGIDVVAIHHHMTEEKLFYITGGADQPRSSPIH